VFCHRSSSPLPAGSRRPRRAFHHDRRVRTGHRFGGRRRRSARRPARAERDVRHKSRHGKRPRGRAAGNRTRAGGAKSVATQGSATVGLAARTEMGPAADHPAGGPAAPAATGVLPPPARPASPETDPREAPHQATGVVGVKGDAEGRPDQARHDGARPSCSVFGLPHQHPSEPALLGVVELGWASGRDPHLQGSGAATTAGITPPHHGTGRASDRTPDLVQ